MRLLLASLGRDLRLRLRQPADLLNPLAFYLIVISLFPLGLGPDREALQGMAPGILWVAALLATLMSLDGIFRADHEDGALEQAALAPYPLGLVALGKMAAHWLATGLPLTLLTPVFGLLYSLPLDALWGLGLSLLLGTPSLSLLGAVAAALTLNLSRGGLLLALLALPLYVPALIFATALATASAAGLGYAAPLYALAAILLAALALAPLAASAALRIALAGA